jgi:hypothetical protein
LKIQKFLEDRELYYELVISKGKGKLTRKSQDMLILIANNTIRKKERNYNNIDDRNDCIQQGLLHMFQNWKNFNPKKYDTAFPYFTEIFKRGLADGINIINNKKNYNDDKIIMISIDRANDGNGLHSF